jgi:hypothetical protein
MYLLWDSHNSLWIVPDVAVKEALDQIGYVVHGLHVPPESEEIQIIGEHEEEVQPDVTQVPVALGTDQISRLEYWRHKVLAAGGGKGFDG